MSTATHYNQAIITKFIGATNRRPSRIKATSASGESVTATYHNLDGNEAQRHLTVAQSLADKLNWKSQLFGGGLKTGFAFVFKD